jgi:hypothetical protein
VTGRGGAGVGGWRQRLIGLAGLAVLAAGCKGEPPPPPTDPAEVRRIEEEVEKARLGEGAAHPRPAPNGKKNGNGKKPEGKP